VCAVVFQVFVELGQKLTKVDLGLYKEDFEEPFIRSTKEFYRVKSRSWLDQDSCPDYMQKVCFFTALIAFDGLFAFAHAKFAKRKNCILNVFLSLLLKMYDSLYGAKTVNFNVEMPKFSQPNKPEVFNLVV